MHDEEDDDDLDWEDEDAPIEMIGSPEASTEGGSNMVADAILALTGEVTKLAILVAEADEDEWRTVGPRLGIFLSSVAAIPTEPRPAKRVGFKPPQPKKAKPPAKQEQPPAKKTTSKRAKKARR